MYGNKVGMEETQEYNYPISIALHYSIISVVTVWPIAFVGI